MKLFSNGCSILVLGYTLSQNLLTLKDTYTLNLKHFTQESRDSQSKGDIDVEFSPKYSKSMNRPIWCFVLFLGDFFLSFIIKLLHRGWLETNNASLVNSKYFCSLFSLRGQVGGVRKVVGVNQFQSQPTGYFMFRTHRWQVRSSENNILCLSGTQTGSHHDVRGGTVFAENALCLWYHAVMVRVKCSHGITWSLL